MVYKNTRLPKLTFGANVGFQGFNYKFDQDQDYALAQFSLAFPLFKGFSNKSRISAETIAVQSLQTKYQETEQKIRMQVINARQDVEAGRYSVTARKASLKSAEKSFGLISRKYMENQATLLELLDARSKYTNSQLELVLSRYDLLKKQAILEQTAALISY